MTSFKLGAFDSLKALASASSNDFAYSASVKKKKKLIKSFFNE